MKLFLEALDQLHLNWFFTRVKYLNYLNFDLIINIRKRKKRKEREKRMTFRLNEVFWGRDQMWEALLRVYRAFIIGCVFML